MPVAVYCFTATSMGMLWVIPPVPEVTCATTLNLAI